LEGVSWEEAKKMQVRDLITTNIFNLSINKFVMFNILKSMKKKKIAKLFNDNHYYSCAIISILYNSAII